MQQPSALEKSITNRIIKAIRDAYPGAVMRKKHGTAWGVAGDPDVYGCANGRAFAIEVKRPGENPTPLQQQRLAEWQAAGALAGVARSVEDAMAILGFGNQQAE